MLRVMIVDDEPRVIHGLCRQIDWQMHYLQLASTAETGEAALALLKKSPVDILITDICMPHMSGLELIDAARAQNPALRCVVISSYNEFDYVKKALQLGVDNYLLKPIDQWELDKTLEQLADNLRRNKHGLYGGRDQTVLFRNNVLDRWVHGDLQDNELYEKAEVLNIDLEAGQSQLCLLEQTGLQTPEEKRQQLDALRDVFHARLDPDIPFEYFIDRHDRGVVILYGDALERHRQRLGALFSDVAQANGRAGQPLFLSIGPVSTGIGSVPADYRATAQYLNYRYLEPQATLYASGPKAPGSRRKGKAFWPPCGPCCCGMRAALPPSWRRRFCRTAKHRKHPGNSWCRR